MGASLFPVGGSPAVCTARAALAAVCRVGGTKTLHLSQTEGASICCCGGRGCRGSREQQSPGPPPEAIAQGPGSREDVPRPPGLEAKEALPLPELLNTGTVPRFPDPPPICSRALLWPGSLGTAAGRKLRTRGRRRAGSRPGALPFVFKKLTSISTSPSRENVCVFSKVFLPPWRWLSRVSLVRDELRRHRPVSDDEPYSHSLLPSAELPWISRETVPGPRAVLSACS